MREPVIWIEKIFGVWEGETEKIVQNAQKIT